MRIKAKKSGDRQVSTKAQLREKHGTPEQFREAVWKAHADLFITTTEAQTAVNNYTMEYENAKG